MTDTTLEVLDATGAVVKLAAQDGGAAGLAPRHIEDATQRTALLAALGLLATDAHALAIIAKLSADPATQTTSAAILAKISSDPATQTTLAALLAKVSSDPATQTTLLAVLAKLTSDPSTATLQTALNTLTGPVTETAPGTDTASSGANGRLQRIAQRLTSLIALFPASIGQKAKAASLAVTLASDDDLLTKFGEVQTTPTANTLLGRAKDIVTALTTPAAPVPSYAPGGIQTIGGTLTRPANTTAYVQYDLICDNGGAPIPFASAVRLSGECLRIERARVRSSAAAAKGQQLRLHLFRDLPTLGVSDNGIFNATGANTLAVSDIAGYLGYIDVSLTAAGTAGASGRGVPDSGSCIITSPGSGTTIYGALELRTAAGYTPVSAEVFSIVLEGEWA